MWKNGVATNLSDENREHGNANSVFVNNNNVYVAGSIVFENTLNPQVILWTNGIATNISNNENHELARSLFVDEDDIYIAGYGFENEIQVVKFWKNGNVTDGLNHAHANSIKIYNNDVYVVGYENSEGFNNRVAKLWLNGETINLSDGTYDAWAESIHIYENDVYIVGSGNNSNEEDLVKVWKNGLTISSTADSIYASPLSIFVK